MSGTQTDIGIKPDHNVKRDGFEKSAPGAYNKAHGRKPKAPILGGARQKAYDALLVKGNATD